MGYSYSDQKSDFDDIYLDEFGEAVTLVTPSGDVSINAIINRPGTGPSKFGPSNTGGDRLEALVSQTAAKGSTTMAPRTYKLKFKLEPDDSAVKTFSISYVKEQYGAWRVGLVG